MAETGGSKPVTTTWAEGVGAIVEEPDAGRKAQGHILYKPKLGVFNWFWQLASRSTAWLEATQVREFGDLTEALAETDLLDGHLFRIKASSTTIGSPGDVVWDIAPYGADDVSANQSLPCDGSRVYITRAGDLVGIDALDGSDDWTASPAGTISRGLGCDGGELAGVDLTNDTVEWFNPTNGASIASAAWGAVITTIEHIVMVHGQYTIVAAVDSGVERVRMYKNHVQVWEFLPGWLLQGCCEPFLTRDNERLVMFCGGPGNASDNVFALELETGAQRWEWPYPSGAGGNFIHDCCSDGHTVFVVGDNFSSESIWALDSDGLDIWAAQPLGGANGSACAVDHRWLYVSDGAGQISAYEKYTGVLVWRIDISAIGSSAVMLCTDGHSLFASIENGGADRLIRVDLGAISTKYVRVANTMDFRRPVVTKALPIGGN